MTILTEHERIVADALHDTGYSNGEIAHKILERRSRGLHREVVREVAALFGAMQ